MKSKTTHEFGIPPHANAEPHRKLMALFRRMTREEGVQTLIDAGIVTKDRKLAPQYTDEKPRRKRSVKRAV